MAKYTNWLPSKRSEQLAMVKVWVDILDVRLGDWGIPAAKVANLKILGNTAEQSFQAAQSSDRSPHITAQCKADFDALTELMRFFYSHYFLVPPLTNADLVSLLLKPHDDKPTHHGAPKSQAMVETFLMGRHQLGLRILYVSGNPDDPANEGFRI
jgi:hypothetical protein